MRNFSKAMILAGFICVLTAIFYMSLFAGSKQDKNKKASDDSVDVYVSGSKILEGRSSPTAGYWKNGKWVSVSSKLFSHVTSIAIEGNDVYAVGTYSGYNDVRVPFLWKNEKWKALSVTNPNKNVMLKLLKILGKDIYVYGTVEHDGNREDIGLWKNGNWESINVPLIYKSVIVNSFYVSEKNMYIGGFVINEKGKSIASYFKNGEIVICELMKDVVESEVKSIYVTEDDGVNP